MARKTIIAYKKKNYRLQEKQLSPTKKVQVAWLFLGQQLAPFYLARLLLTYIIFQRVYIFGKSRSSLGSYSANGSWTFAFKALLHFNISCLA